MAIAQLALIGLGQIGIRHLQALTKIDREAILQIVDPSVEALEKAKTELLLIKGSGNIKKVDFLNSIDSLHPNLDLIIIATNSKIRRIVVEKLLNQNKVKYMILEKILFQKKKDFKEINELLKKKKVKAWVNCPLRMLAFYKDIKHMLGGSKRIDYHVSYSNIGLGTNAIHHIDLFSFLTNQTTFIIDPSNLDQQIIPSKRAGFLELTGTLSGKTIRGDSITITSYLEGDVPPLVQIISDKVRCCIRENEKKAYFSSEKNGWVWEEIPYHHPYQSQLTHLAVQQILDTGTTDLTPYDVSWKLHLPLLDAFMKHIQKNSEKEVFLCPIT